MMSIRAKKGYIVVYAYPSNGYTYDKEQCSKYLVWGWRYTVDHTDVHESHTDVYLKEVPYKIFNSVMFEDLDKYKAMEEAKIAMAASKEPKSATEAYGDTMKTFYGNQAEVKPSLTYKDISSEEARTYDFKVVGLNGHDEYRAYSIQRPVRVYVGKTTHRVVDEHGVVHCVPAPGQMGCVLRWIVKKGQPEVSY